MLMKLFNFKITPSINAFGFTPASFTERPTSTPRTSTRRYPTAKRSHQTPTTRRWPWEDRLPYPLPARTRVGQCGRLGGQCASPLLLFGSVLVVNNVPRRADCVPLIQVEHPPLERSQVEWRHRRSRCDNRHPGGCRNCRGITHERRARALPETDFHCPLWTCRKTCCSCTKRYASNCHVDTLF